MAELVAQNGWATVANYWGDLRATPRIVRYCFNDSLFVSVACSWSTVNEHIPNERWRVGGSRPGK